MGELFMMAGIVSAIILSLVGVVKLPFKNFKANKPKLYKATFTLLSILLSIGCCVITQKYVLVGGIFTINFAILLGMTFAGVFGLYSSYEGLGLKNLVKIFLNKMQELADKAPETKFAKYIDKIGIEKAIEIVNNKQLVEQPNEIVETTEVTEVTEQQKETTI